MGKIYMIFQPPVRMWDLLLIPLGCLLEEENVGAGAGGLELVDECLPLPMTLIDALEAMLKVVLICHIASGAEIIARTCETVPAHSSYWILPAAIAHHVQMLCT